MDFQRAQRRKTFDYGWIIVGISLITWPSLTESVLLLRLLCALLKSLLEPVNRVRAFSILSIVAAS